MYIERYIAHSQQAEENLSKALENIIQKHEFESDVVEMCEKFKNWSEGHIKSLLEVTTDLGHEKRQEGLEDILADGNESPYDLLWDLHTLSLLMQDAYMSWNILGQAAKALRNERLDKVCKDAVTHLDKEVLWVMTRAKNAAAQVFVVS